MGEPAERLESETFEELLDRSRLTRQDVVRRTGLGRSTVAAIMKGNYTGKPETVQVVRDFLVQSVKSPTVRFHTKDQILMESAMAMCLEDRSFSCITAPSGVGKTTTARRFMDAHPGRVLYVKILDGTSAGGVLTLLNQKLGLPLTGPTQAFGQARLRRAFAASDYDMLIVDEADLLVAGNYYSRQAPKRIAVLRELWEGAFDEDGEPTKGLLLLGLPALADYIDRHQDYLTNRVQDDVRCGLPTEEDFRAFWQGPCGMKETASSRAVCGRVAQKGAFRKLVNLARTARKLGGSVDAALRFNQV